MGCKTIGMDCYECLADDTDHGGPLQHRTGTGTNKHTSWRFDQSGGCLLARCSGKLMHYAVNVTVKWTIRFCSTVLDIKCMLIFHHQFIVTGMFSILAGQFPSSCLVSEVLKAPWKYGSDSIEHLISGVFPLRWASLCFWTLREQSLPSLPSCCMA